jgi:ribonuclease-3
MREIVGYTPSNIHIYRKAFLHKPDKMDKFQAARNNERLEFLGDALLGMVVGEYLFSKYPGSDEGFLTKMRSKIVKRKSLNSIAGKMDLEDLLHHYNPGTRISPSMLGNALEALVGAVYLDAGYHRAKRFVVKKMLRGGYLDIHNLETYDDNYKSQLLEWCQKHNKLVAYKVVSKYKQDKRDRFRVMVVIDDQEIAHADDFNKKSAEQSASEKALQKLGVLGKKKSAATN